jgi:hypothetical protein
MLLTRAIMAGVRLGVFESLDSAGPATVLELSGRLACAPAGIEALVGALAGSGYLRRTGDRYENTGAARRWLLSGAPRSVVRYTRFMPEQWGWLQDVEERIRDGSPIEIHGPARDRSYWERYLGALEEIARQSAGPIVAAIPLRRAPRRLLDVAGGHGAFSIALCRRYPGLTAEILDLEPATETARPWIEGSGLSGRIRLRAGDLRTTDWGEGNDIVLLFNILHHIEPEEAAAAVRHARAALAPGGTLAIWELQDTLDPKRPSQIGGLMGLFFYATSGRRVPPRELVERWMREGGLEGVRRRTLRVAPFGHLFTGFAARRP